MAYALLFPMAVGAAAILNGYRINPEAGKKLKGAVDTAGAALMVKLFIWTFHKAQKGKRFTDPAYANVRDDDNYSGDDDDLCPLCRKKELTSMLFCSNCGNEIEEGAAFCSGCGGKVEQKAPSRSAKSDHISFDVITKERLQMVKVELDNEAFRYEAGAMHYMQGNLELKSDAPGVGKFFKSFITREKIVKPIIRGTGTVYLTPSFGEFTILALENDEWILDQGAYYASEIGIELGAYTNRAINALFSGEKWFQTIVAGTGKVVITSAGPLETINLNNDKLVVDGSFAVARTAGIELEVTKASKGIFSSVISGEGLVNTFAGTGKVLVAPVDNYFNTLVHTVRAINSNVLSLRK